jgi:hypothetical protein
VPERDATPNKVRRVAAVAVLPPTPLGWEGAGTAGQAAGPRHGDSSCLFGDGGGGGGGRLEALPSLMAAMSVRRGQKGLRRGAGVKRARPNPRSWACKPWPGRHGARPPARPGRREPGKKAGAHQQRRMHVPKGCGSRTPLSVHEAVLHACSSRTCAAAPGGRRGAGGARAGPRRCVSSPAAQRGVWAWVPPRLWGAEARHRTVRFVWQPPLRRARGPAAPPAPHHVGLQPSQQLLSRHRRLDSLRRRARRPAVAAAAAAAALSAAAAAPSDLVAALLSAAAAAAEHRLAEQRLQAAALVHDAGHVAEEEVQRHVRARHLLGAAEWGARGG